MEIKIFKPRKSIQKYIKYFWYLNCQEIISSEKMRLIPTGTPEILFHLNGGYGKFENNEIVESSIVIIGQQTKFNEYIPSLNRGIISAVVNPVFFSDVIKNSASDCSDFCINSVDVWGKEALELNEKLFLKKTFYEQFELIENFLEKLIYKKDFSEDKLIFSVISEINQQGGNIKLKQLFDKYNISQRQIERKFIDKIGLSPKSFCKIVKLQYSLFLAQNSDKLSLTELSYLSNYYDQPHYVKSFKDITGYSPKDFFKICKPVSDYFTYL